MDWRIALLPYALSVTWQVFVKQTPRRRDDGQRRLFPIQKRVERLAIMSLSAGDINAQRPPQSVYSRVNLTAAIPLLAGFW